MPFASLGTSDTWPRRCVCKPNQEGSNHPLKSMDPIAGTSSSAAPLQQQSQVQHQRCALAQEAVVLLHKRLKVRRHGVSESGSMHAAGSVTNAAAAAAAAAAALRRLQVQVKDGRVLVGDFTCLDKQGNIILVNTYEHLQLNGQ